jgi:predicted MPP superfamily phosphohydrolase
MLRVFVVLGSLLGLTAFSLAKMLSLSLFEAGLLSLGFLVFLLSSQIVYRRQPWVFDMLWYKAFSWVGAVGIGLWGSFLMILLPVALINFLVGFLPIGHEAEFLPRGLLLVIGWLSVAFVALGFLETLRGPRVKTLLLPILGLPAGLDGFRVVQVSDLHIGPTLKRAFSEDVVRRVNELQPDLIVVTGDLADALPDSIAHDLAPLALLRAKYGVFYVTGNHEYYWDVAGLVAKAASLGMTPLLNENCVLRVGPSKLLVAGVTDPMGANFGPAHVPDLAKALHSPDPVDFKILLAHRPGVYLEAETLGANLQFSGHTHAGQFFPFSLVIPFAHKYYRGLNRHGRSWVYVNPGTGYWGPPNRFGVPSEITFMTLKDV